jgi:hypothetical protein
MPVPPLINCLSQLVKYLHDGGSFVAQVAGEGGGREANAGGAALHRSVLGADGAHAPVYHQAVCWRLHTTTLFCQTCYSLWCQDEYTYDTQGCAIE